MDRHIDQWNGIEQNRGNSSTQVWSTDFGKGENKFIGRRIMIVFSTNDTGRIGYP